MRLAVAIPLLLVAAAPARAMTVAEFLARARVLKAQGPLAMVSPDYALLKREMLGINAAYRADIRAARAAGRPPHSCPPAQVQARPEAVARVLLAELERIPPAQRGMSMKSAFYAFMKRRYPCR